MKAVQEARLTCGPQPIPFPCTIGDMHSRRKNFTMNVIVGDLWTRHTGCVAVEGAQAMISNCGARTLSIPSN